jgi:hypothetical protein
MKKGTILLVSFIFLVYLNSLKAQKFYISLGSGFKDDTVSLNINNKLIFQDLVITSDPILGYSSDAMIIYKNDSVRCLNNNKVINIIPFSYDKKLKIILVINKRPYALYAYLKKGKYIVISKHLYYYNVYLNQFKKPIKLE